MKIDVVLTNGNRDIWGESDLSYKIHNDGCLVIYVGSYIRAIYNSTGWVAALFSGGSKGSLGR